MTLNRGVQRAIIGTYFAALAVIYAIAWLAPAVGLARDDAAYLLTARAIATGQGYPQTQFPPVFPGLLALFTLISQQTQWLKALPLLCTAGWLVLTHKLLLKMGASRNDAFLLVGLTAASPMVVFLSTNLMAESCFALLMTAALLALLEERAWLAGCFAGLATLTRIAGVPLIVVCMLTLVVRRRFRSAIIFAAVATIMAAPWFGWALAHPSNTYRGWNVLTGLAASEKATVLGRNIGWLFATPFSLLSGFSNIFGTWIFIAVLAWSLFVRRQLLPDLLIVLYSLVLICWTWPPERFVAPILPLVFWIVWRVFRLMELREALAALVLIFCLLPVAADVIRLPATRSSGYFPVSGQIVDDWPEMQKLFTLIRAHTSPEDVLLANMNDVFYLNTGRRTIRGFNPTGFELFYSPRPLIVTPDGLTHAIREAQVRYVGLTPDQGMPESAAFHRSIEALERGGVLETVIAPGLSRDYRLLRVTR
ncbi:MAG TPA: hypothetical protein VK789_22335 [Bryobacteraceae bacterium]|nr:hypothetical protein [Bryobacteraceae bacterium]